LLGGVMVIVLATRPKVRGFKPGRERWIFEGYKNQEGEVKQPAPRGKFLRRYKIPCGMTEILIGKIQLPFLAKLLSASLLGAYCNQSRELWWMHRKLLELRQGAQHIRKWSQLHGTLCTIPHRNNNQYYKLLQLGYILGHFLFSNSVRSILTLDQWYSLRGLE
jgi:hypothetical protein